MSLLPIAGTESSGDSRAAVSGLRGPLDQIVPPLSIDMPNAVKVRIKTVIDLSNDASIADLGSKNAGH